MVNETRRQYYLKHREKIIERSRLWRRNNPESLKRYRGTRRTYNLKYQRETENANSRKFYKNKRQELIDILGGKCIRCGFSDIRALQFDHINGGGIKELKLMGGMIKMVCHYLKHPEEIKTNIQLLCSNCNWIKRHENNECHRKYLLEHQP